MATTNVFGGNNQVLSIAYLVCAGLCALTLIGFVAGKIRTCVAKH